MTIEALEVRQFMAGNVLVREINGVCRISGTNGDDAINIVQTQSGDLAFSSPGGMNTFNGQTTLLFDNGHRWMRFDLGQGNDKLVIRLPNPVNRNFKIAGSGSIARDLRQVVCTTMQIQGGLGSDSIQVRDCRFIDGFDFIGGAGEDLVKITGTAVWGACNITDAGGKSNVTIKDSRFDQLAINLSPHNDNLWFFHVLTTTNPLVVNMGDGDDLFWQNWMSNRDAEP